MDDRARRVRGVLPGAAVVSVERFWSHGTSAADAGEFGPGAFSPDPASPGWEYRERARCEGTLCWYVLEWLGPEVSADDRAPAERIAESIGLARVDRWTETDGVRTTLRSGSPPHWGFYLFVAIGDEASPAIASQAWEIADPLRFLASPSP